jgi:hypothetical protein
LHTNARVFAAVVGAGATLVLGALGIGAGTAPRVPASTFESSQMTLGTTSTANTVPDAPTEGVAAPAIRGPAQLPTEEEGLTGIDGRHR